MVRCGIIGCGAVAMEMHMPALRAIPGVRVEAVCEENRHRLGTFLSENGIARGCTDVDTFMDENRKLDFVIVATPGFTHYDLAKRVIERGFHVFIEKPLSLSVAECLDLAKRAKDHSVKVCVGQTWRFRDPVLRGKEACDRGLVGKVYQVNVVHHSGSLFHVSEPAWSWREKEHKTLLYEHAIHLIDLQVYFAGPAQEILGVEVISDPSLQATTHVYALIKHASGAVAIVDVQAFSSSNFTQCEIYGTANDVQMKFFPHGYRLYSGRVNPVDELYNDFLRLRDFAIPVVSGVIRRPVLPRRVLPHYRILQRFIESVKNEAAAVPVSIGDVLPTMELLEWLGAKVYG